MNELTGIDVHVHIHDERARARQGPQAQRRFEEQARYFRREPTHVSVEEAAQWGSVIDITAVRGP